MKLERLIVIPGIVFTAAIILIPMILFAADNNGAAADPWAGVQPDTVHTDHTPLFSEPFESAQDVTRACLSCHTHSAQEVMHTTHWTWKAEPVDVEWSDEPVSTGKANVLNNYCIGIQSNWTGCTKCHAGYGWSDANFDFAAESNVDCLVCHEQTGAYVKGSAGVPVDGVDLLSAAQSVASPTRRNCGTCHFDGGGGNGVKHGDLDQSLLFPNAEIDVHMGQYDFQCVDCHATEDHNIQGRAISVSVETITNQVACTDCHAADGHNDERINLHTDTVACQTCHIPYGAVRDATKMSWDWSTAGQDLPEDPHTYLKIKGSFVYETNFVPAYGWYNGNVTRYLLGDPIDPTQSTILNQPQGDVSDPSALIVPFKVHTAKQPYDTVFNYLLQPKTVGETGYWTTFDWNSALEQGAAAVGMKYSGEYGFASTEMYWNLSHMVVPSENALQCTDCHTGESGEQGRLDWLALGYSGDPMIWGGRK